MASELKIFTIYSIQKEEKYFLLQTERPGFSNASQIQENAADKIEQNKREYILTQIGKNYNRNDKTNFEFIGEFQGYPIGDKLYADKGNIELNIYYMATESGWPWIILGTANSETGFLTELNDDDDLLRLKPIGAVKLIKAIFLTEQDFDLSEIDNSETKGNSHNTDLA